MQIDVVRTLGKQMLLPTLGKQMLPDPGKSYCSGPYANRCCYGPWQTDAAPDPGQTDAAPDPGQADREKSRLELLAEIAAGSKDITEQIQASEPQDSAPVEGRDGDRSSASGKRAKQGTGSHLGKQIQACAGRFGTCWRQRWRQI